ncbi:MAG TPA: hypothetical protein VM433_06055 [Mycobacteriales bacterium]|nr:hypothetical protein [Mycobacteriales bacterium]
MSRRLQVLFLLSLLGVLLCLGLVVAAVAGPWAALGYGVAAVVLLAAGSAKARAAQAAGKARSLRAGGRTCTCCTGSQLDPVQVVE